MKNYYEIKQEIITRIDRLKRDYLRAYEYYQKLFENDYSLKIEKGKEKNTYTNTLYELKNSDYIFYNFETWDMGAEVALRESEYKIIEGIHINYCIFEKCNIKNIIFKNCSFSGSKFKNVNFESVTFQKCMFSVPVLEKGYREVDDTYFAPAVFENCIFVGKFLDCDVEYAMFSRVNFTLTKFWNCSLQHSIFDTCAISNVEMKDCNLSEFAIYNTDILDISFTDERLTIVNENTLIDYRINAIRKKAKQKTESGWIASDYDDLCLKKAKTIRNISRLFAENGFPSYAGEYFYRAKKAEFKGLHTIDKMKSCIALVLCGYGERPSFTFCTIIFTTMIFAFLYMISGVDAAGHVIKYSFEGATPILVLVADYGKCLFFSITTFSTVGYGNYVPVGSGSMIISAIHMIVGVSLCALWTGCIFRKIAR